jgi:LuxR family maltose regulon positive regulatory protein
MELATTLSAAEEVTDELAGQVDAAGPARLRALAELGLLVPVPDVSPPTHRFPEVVRRAIVPRARRVEGGGTAALHRDLSRWYAAHGQPAAALHHAVLAEDWAEVVGIIESSYRQLQFGHRNGELYEALLATPLEAIRTSRLAVVVRDARLPVPEDLYARAVSLPNDVVLLASLGAGGDARRHLETAFAVNTSLRARGRIGHAVTHAERALVMLKAARSAHPALTADLHASLELQLGITFLLGGRFADAVTHLHIAFEHAADNPRRYIASDAAGKQALAFAVMGEGMRATRWLAAHDEAPLDPSWLTPRILSSAAAARLLVSVDRLDLPAAEAAFATIIDLEVRREELWGLVTFAHGRFALAAGAAQDMLGQLHSARERAAHWFGDGAVAGPLLAALEADLLLALGRGNPAAAILSGEYADHPLLQVGRARLALLSGQVDDALRLSADAAWELHAQTRQRVEMALIHAVAAHRSGQGGVARSSLRSAISTAQLAGDLLDPFRTVPREELLEIAGDDEARAFLGTPALAERPEVFPARVELVRLTRREQQLLERLAVGLTTQQIAHSLRTSYNTVRVQQRGLYRKLEVGSRDDAVARGRQYGLLPYASADASVGNPGYPPG